MCGAVRYRINSLAESAGYCHCRMCQRAAGAPMVAWAAFPRDAFVFTAGTPAAYRSSPAALRRFCARCGTPLTFEYVSGVRNIDVTIASLDDPAAIEPSGYHIWTSSRFPWLLLIDDVPKYPGEAPGVGDVNRSSRRGG